MYTLYQREKMSVDVDNYFISLKTNNETPVKNLHDPFDWNDILKEIKKTDKKELFTLATEILNDYEIEEWSFGGGTALSY